MFVPALFGGQGGWAEARPSRFSLSPCWDPQTADGVLDRRVDVPWKNAILARPHVMWDQVGGVRETLGLRRGSFTCSLHADGAQNHWHY